MLGLSQREKSAFTLTELLMVIAVIGILATLLLVAVSQARGKAQRIQCANHVGQLGLALQAFVNDNSTYPLYVNPSWISTLQHTELSVTTNRVNAKVYLNQGVWKCPVANKPPNWPNRLLKNWQKV